MMRLAIRSWLGDTGADSSPAASFPRTSMAARIFGAITRNASGRTLIFTVMPSDDSVSLQAIRAVVAQNLD
jgi:hypothetical protein